MNPSLVIRRATAADEPALWRLAALDSRPVPRGDVLVAESEGAIVAAVSLHDSRAVADPFAPTAELVALLRMRAEQIRAAPALRLGGELAAGRRDVAAAR